VFDWQQGKITGPAKSTHAGLAKLKLCNGVFYYSNKLCMEHDLLLLSLKHQINIIS